jgi:hypothetical protein
MSEQKSQNQGRTGEKPAVTPSGFDGENPGTAGPGPTGVKSGTPENKDEKLNPSAPGNVGTTPGSTGTK